MCSQSARSQVTRLRKDVTTTRRLLGMLPRSLAASDEEKVWGSPPGAVAALATRVALLAGRRGRTAAASPAARPQCGRLGLCRLALAGARQGTRGPHANAGASSHGRTSQAPAKPALRIEVPARQQAPGADDDPEDEDSRMEASSPAVEGMPEPSSPFPIMALPTDLAPQNRRRGRLSVRFSRASAASALAGAER
jgi:hypothetical protein